MKLYSWNVNGLRAVLKKGALQTFLEAEKPDVLCLQEIKAKPEQIDYDFEGYKVFYNPAVRPGYSGTAILISNKFNADSIDVSLELSKKEGRIIVLNFEKFYLVNVYTPNSKRDLSRLKLREETWDPEFLKLLQDLEKEKPVVTCGDFNAAHEEIDLARPKNNYKNAGFTEEERRGITNLISAGFVDTFRVLNPEAIRYTWWPAWGSSRANNVGWRIDYFFVSKVLKEKLKSAEIYEQYQGSDHCPISIELEA